MHFRREQGTDVALKHEVRLVRPQGKSGSQRTVTVRGKPERGLVVVSSSRLVSPLEQRRPMTIDSDRL